MKTPRILVPAVPILLISLPSFSLISPAVTAGAVSRQERRITRHGDALIVEEGPVIVFPEATEPCTPEESEWWKQTREAGNGILLGFRRDNAKFTEKSKVKFLLLLFEGQQKGYHVPLKDRPPLALLRVNPTYPPTAWKNNIVGTVELAITVGSDGLVRDVQVEKGLGGELDQNTIRAWRQCVFLPAVQDGAFVAHRQTVKNHFETGQRRAR